MAYGTIKVDNITFDNGGVDKLITVSGLFYSTSGALTVTGTISGGNVTAPTATFTTLTGTTTAGTTATFTSGSFSSILKLFDYLFSHPQGLLINQVFYDWVSWVI